MTRGELSADDATWALAGTRTKNKRPHVVPLAPLVRKLLTGTPQIVGQSGYVFTTTGEAPVSGFSKAKRQIDAAMLAAAKKNPEARYPSRRGGCTICVGHVQQAWPNSVSPRTSSRLL